MFSFGRSAPGEYGYLVTNWDLPEAQWVRVPPVYLENVTASMSAYMSGVMVGPDGILRSSCRPVATLTYVPPTSITRTLAALLEAGLITSSRRGRRRLDDAPYSRLSCPGQSFQSAFSGSSLR